MDKEEIEKNDNVSNNKSLVSNSNVCNQDISDVGAVFEKTPLLSNAINEQLLPVISTNAKVNDIFTKNVSFHLQDYQKQLSNYLEIGKSISETLEPIISKQQEIISEIMKKINPMKDMIEMISEKLRPISLQIMENIPKISTYFLEFSGILEQIAKNPNNVFNWIRFSEVLRSYFWFPPYLMSREQLMDLLSSIESEEELDKELTEYFTNEIVERLFDDVGFRVFEQHRDIWPQIKDAFNNESYALVNTGLFSVIDSLCSFFVKDKRSTYRIDLFKPILELEKKQSVDFYNISILSMVNSNINFLYGEDNNTHKLARRHLSQHGQFFSNNRIDTIMLLHTVYYLLECIEVYKDYKGKLIFLKKKVGGKKIKKYKIINQRQRKSMNL